MKNWLDKMERRFGRYAIRNLTMYLLAGYAIGYLLSFTMPQLLTYFTLEPALILKGQVWRLLSWVIIPPNDNIIFVIFMMLLYYSLGNTLESYWGAFRYNVYIFSGILFTVIGAFIVNGLIGGITGFGSLYSTYYINMSIFLACASIMPDYQLLLYGIIPIKMKWLAILDVVLLAVDAVQGGLIIRIVIIASLLNFIIFFFCNRNLRGHSPKQVARRKKFQKQISRPQNQYAGGAKHRCAVCGRTELDDPTLEFRYCSKCNGNYEYCQDHLFTHEHVK
ncbi:hypothetical protein [Coprococcus comes]|uniref:hypothetical protein n=1 Tax=Coprococcus comes TaxID=410072 RepID=UPI00189BA88F|nr:hypothetical protein [Coprococcus comes]